MQSKLNLSFKFSNELGLFDFEINGYKRFELDSNRIFITQQDNYISNITNIDFIKNNNGILIDLNNGISIYTDLYRNIPIFFKIQDNQDIFVSSDVEKLSQHENDFDEVGLWENILFESAIGQRTIYKRIKQLPAVSKFSLNSKKQISIIKYYNFLIEYNPQIRTINQAEIGLYEHLERIFSNPQLENKLLMGLSGGLDSRLTLLMIKKMWPNSDLKLTTFGYDKSIFEYEISKSITKQLNLNSPEFHYVNENSYQIGLNKIVVKSGNQIGLNHSHFYSYLYENCAKLQDRTIISNFITDGVFGFACEETKNPNIESKYLKKLLKHRQFINPNIFDEIYADIIDLQKPYEVASNFSSINEYIYLTERTHKFHTYLLYTYGEFCNTLPLYSDFRLLNYIVSLDFRFRYDKKLASNMMLNLMDELKVNKTPIISSTFANSKQNKLTISYYIFRALNLYNALMLRFFNGKYRLKNKFLTESQNYYLKNNYYDKLIASVNILSEKNLFNKKAENHFSKLPFRSGFDISSRFQIIGLGHILRSKN